MKSPLKLRTAADICPLASQGTQASAPGQEAPASDDGRQPGASAGSPHGKYPVTAWSQQRFYRRFVKAALAIALTLGFTTGAGMLLLPAIGVDRGAWWLTHAQSHGAAQLFGWAGLFTMGVAFHVVPRFRNGDLPFPWPQRIALWAVTAGIFLRFAGQSLHDFAVGPPLLAASGLAVAGGVTAFTYAMTHALRSGASPHTRVELWIWAGSLWAFAAALLHLAGAWNMAESGGMIVAPVWNNAFITAALLGFVGNFIFGVSTRAVASFLNLKPGPAVLNYAAFAVINGGILAQVVGGLYGWGAVWAGIATVTQAAGIIAFVLGLRVLEPPAKPQKHLPGTYGRYEWLIRGGYGWIVLAALFMLARGIEDVTGGAILPAMSSAPVVHLLTLGFITGIMFGMGARMLPLFEGSEIPMHRLLDASLVTLNLSVLTRVVFGFASGEPADMGLAASGALGLAALVFFAIPLYAALRPSAREAYHRRARAFGKQRISNVSIRPQEQG